MASEVKILTICNSISERENLNQQQFECNKYFVILLKIINFICIAEKIL